jgi:hypothetical protein
MKTHFDRNNRLAVWVTLIALVYVQSAWANTPDVSGQESTRMSGKYLDPSYTTATPNHRDATKPRHHDPHRWFALDHINVHLFDDPDRNGFYSSLELAFDVDVEYGTAWVYADIWIRPHGGYYEHLYSTDIFAIHGQGSNDTYVVSADLLANYHSDYYDLMIELYDADGYASPVALADPWYHPALSALPLEARHHHHPSGSLSISASGAGVSLLIIPSMALLYGYRYRRAWKRPAIKTQRNK